MSRSLSVFLITLLVAGIQGHSQAHKARDGKNHDSSTREPLVVTPKQSDDSTPQPAPPKHLDADVRVVSTPSKDLYDRAAIWINLALALIGSVGIGVAVATLSKIKYQAEEMRLQRVAMQDSLTAMRSQAELIKRQADAMDVQNNAIRSRERARLTVSFPPMSDPEFDGWRTATEEGEELWFDFTVHILNHGISKAFGVRASMNFKVVPKESPFVHDYFADVPISNVIGDVSEESPIPITYETLIPVRDIDKIQEGLSELFVYGEIRYRDVFGDSRMTPFRFVWNLDEWNDVDGTPRLSGGWENRSPRSI